MDRVDLGRRGLRARRGGERAAVRRVRDDQRRDRARRRASARPRRARRPSGRTAASRVSATSVSRSSVRSVASRTRAASVRTTAQRAASRPTQRRRAPGPSGRGPRSGAGLLAPLGVTVGARTWCRLPATRRSKASCWAAAIAIAFSVVKSYWNGDRGARRRPAPASVWTWLSKSSAFGATMSRVASWPTRASSGCSGRMSTPRIAARATIRIAGRDEQARDVARA